MLSECLIVYLVLGFFSSAAKLGKEFRKQTHLALASEDAMNLRYHQFDTMSVGMSRLVIVHCAKRSLSARQPPR